MNKNSNKSLAEIMSDKQNNTQSDNTQSIFGSMSKGTDRKLIYLFPYNGQIGDMTDAAREEMTQLSNYSVGACDSTGLEHFEELLLIPELIDIRPDDNSYRIEKRRFYESMHYAVPANGLELDVTIPNPTEPISPTNMPLKPLDYVKYRQALVHPKIAKSRDEAEASPFVRFYIEDKTLESSNQMRFIKIQQNADEYYKEIYETEDEAKARRFLVLAGKDFHTIRGMSKSECLVALKDFCTKNPSEFIELCQDKLTETRYMVLELLQAGILREIGNKILIVQSQTQIGNSREEAAMYLSDATNSVVKLSLEESFRHKYK